MAYKSYRTKALLAWIVSNVIFSAVVLIAVMTSNATSTSFSFLDGFSLFMLGLIIFKFTTGLLYVIYWNILQSCCKNYRNPKISEEMMFALDQANKEKWESTDEEEWDNSDLNNQTSVYTESNNNMTMDQMNATQGELKRLTNRNSRPVSLLHGLKKQTFDEETPDGLPPHPTPSVEEDQDDFMRHIAGNHESQDPKHKTAKFMSPRPDSK